MTVVLHRMAKKLAADRSIPAGLGLYFVFAAWQLHRLWAHTDDHVFFDWLWPYVFVAAGILALAYAWKPTSPALAAWSGGFMIAACLSRAWAVIAAVISDTTDLDDARAWLVAGTYAVLAYSIAAIWHRILGPSTFVRRHLR